MIESWYTNSVKAEWLENGIDMRILESISFIDSKGKQWYVPAGTVVNGASIPKPLWSIVGSPYVGLFRDASVIHDHYCDVRIEPHKKVHKMFYEAMIASGVPKDEAATKYAAVMMFGPKWDDNGNDIGNSDLTPANG